MGKNKNMLNLSEAAKLFGGCDNRTSQIDFIDFLVLNGIVEKVVMNHKKVGKKNYYGLNSKHTLYYIFMDHVQEIICAEKDTGKTYPNHIYIDTYLATVFTRLYRISKIRGRRIFTKECLKDTMLDVALEYVPKNS